MNRREWLKATLGALGGAAFSSDLAAETGRTPIVNGAEHAWVINNRRFPINPELSNCPKSKPARNYSMEHLLAEMDVHGIDVPRVRRVTAQQPMRQRLRVVRLE
jgi:hypothetical protein